MRQCKHSAPSVAAPLSPVGPPGGTARRAKRHANFRILGKTAPKVNSPTFGVHHSAKGIICRRWANSPPGCRSTKVEQNHIAKRKVTPVVPRRARRRRANTAERGENRPFLRSAPRLRSGQAGKSGAQGAVSFLSALAVAKPNAYFSLGGQRKV